MASSYREAYQRYQVRRALAILGLSLVFLASTLWAGRGYLSVGERMRDAGWGAALAVPREAPVTQFLLRCQVTPACATRWNALYRAERGFLPPLFLLLVGGTAALALVAKRPQRGLKEPGSARWASREDIRPLTHGKDLTGYLGHSEWGEVLRLPVSKRLMHVGIIGSTGARKTSGMIYPMLAEDANDEVSVVLFDLKYPDPEGGLLGALKLFEAAGKPIQVFAPFSELTLRWPLLRGILSETGDPAEEYERASEVADILMRAEQNAREENNFYWKNERLLLRMLIWATARSSGSLHEVYRVAEGGLERMREFVEEHLGAEGAAVFERVKSYGEQTREGIVGGLLMRLSIFRNRYLARATAYGEDPQEEVNIRRLFEEPGLLYIGIPQSKLRNATEARALLQLIKRSLDNELLKAAEELGNRRKVKLVSVYFDEFINFGRLPNIDRDLATMRSYGVSYTLVIQNLSQAVAEYTLEGFHAFFDTLGTQIWFPASIRGERDRRYLARSLGETTVELEARSESREAGLEGWIDPRYSHTRRVSSLPLLSESEMREWPEKAAIVDVRGLPPVRVLVPIVIEETVEAAFPDPSGRRVRRRVRNQMREKLRPITERIERPLEYAGAQVILYAGKAPSFLADDGALRWEGPSAEEALLDWAGRVAQEGALGRVFVKFDAGGAITKIALYLESLPEALREPPGLQEWKKRRWVRVDKDRETKKRVISLLPSGMRVLQAISPSLLGRLVALRNTGPALLWVREHAARVRGHPECDPDQPALAFLNDTALLLPEPVAQEVLDEEVVAHLERHAVEGQPVSFVVLPLVEEEYTIYNEEAHEGKRDDKTRETPREEPPPAAAAAPADDPVLPRPQRFAGRGR